MLTEEEKRIINNFHSIYKSVLADEKLQLYKSINSNLEILTDCSADDFNFKNYCKQFYYDLTNFYSTSLLIEISKCLNLLRIKSRSHKYSFKVGPEKQMLEKVLSCVKALLNENRRLYNEEEFYDTICNIFSDRKIPYDVLLNGLDEFYTIGKIIFRMNYKGLKNKIISILCKYLGKQKVNESGDSTLTTSFDHNLNEEHTSFWFQYLLPEVFETNDIGIRNSIIAAFEFYIPVLNTIDYQSQPFWPEVKEKVLNTYLVKLHEYRSTYNEWYRLWSILIQILISDVLKKASVINVFLSIVELGFRNEDLKRRAQAYICWKTLIDILAKNNELHIPKRIKLLSIPFRPSKYKTVEISTNKFKSWWYLIVQLNQNITDHIDTLFLPFLEHMFGKYAPESPFHMYFDPNPSESAEQNTPVVHLFAPIRNMAITTLLYMIGQPVKSIDVIRSKNNIEPLTKPLDLTYCFKDIGTHLIYYCCEATILLSQTSIPNQSDVCIALWKGLVEQAKFQSTNEHFQLIVELLNQMIPITKKAAYLSLSKLIPDILEILTTSEMYPFKEVNYFYQQDCLLDAIKSIINLILNKDCLFYFKTNSVITNLLSDLTRYRHNKLINDVVYYVTVVCDNYSDNQQNLLKLEMWHTLNISINNLLDENFESLDSDVLQMAVNYLNWPLKNISLMETDENIIKDWTKIYVKIEAKAKFSEFTNRLAVSLKKLVGISPQDHLTNYIQYFIVLMKSKRKTFDNSKQTADILEIAESIFNRFLLNDLKSEYFKFVYVEFNKYLNGISARNLIDIADDLKSFIKISVKIIQKDNTFTDISTNTTTIIQNILKKSNDINTKVKSELLNFCSTNNASTSMPAPDLPPKFVSKSLSSKKKSDKVLDSDVMVTIPRVWNFCPEKLTEHQIEKMKERRSDIPALYSELSNSQESISLKPWAPKTVPFSNSVSAPTTPNNKDCAHLPIKPRSLSPHVVATIIVNDDNAVDEASGKLIEANKDLVIDNIIENAQKHFEMVKSSDIIEASQPSPIASRVSRRRSSLNLSSTGSNTSYEDKRKYRKSVNNKLPKVVTTETNEKPAISADSEFSDTINTDGEKSITTQDITNIINSPKKLINNINRNGTNNVVTTRNNNNHISEMDTEPNTEIPEEINISIDEIKINESVNKSIRSSPDLPNAAERERDLLNSTIDLSPIPVIGKLNIASPVLLNGYNSTPNISTPPEKKRRIPEIRLGQTGSPQTSTMKKTTRFQTSSNRGKQLLDLCRQQKSLNDSRMLNAAAAETSVYSKPEEIVSTSSPKVSENLLTFSKKLPPADASPSISILKRKCLNEDSGSDVESPAYKRKRVSFHDPPVSATKEYEADDDKRVKRCLIGCPQKSLNNLLEKETNTNLPLQIEKTQSSLSLPLHATADSDEDDISLTPSPSIIFPNEDAVLQSIFEKYTPEEFKEKYLESGRTINYASNLPSIKKELKTIMTEDIKVKTEILDYLSENFSKDFLQNAIQENSSTSVCDSLNLTNLVDYTFKKALNSAEHKNILSTKIEENFHKVLKCLNSNVLIDVITEEIENDNKLKKTVFEKIEKHYENNQSTDTMDKSLFEHLFKLFSNKMSKEQILKCLNEKL